MWIMMLARGCLTIWFASLFATHWLFWSQRFLICSPNPWKVFDSNLKWRSKLILRLILWSWLTWWCCCHPCGEWSTGGAASARAREQSGACCGWWTNTGGCLKKNIFFNLDRAFRMNVILKSICYMLTFRFNWVLFYFSNALRESLYTGERTVCYGEMKYNMTHDIFQQMLLIFSVNVWSQYITMSFKTVPVLGSCAPLSLL